MDDSGVASVFDLKTPKGLLPDMMSARKTGDIGSSGVYVSGVMETTPLLWTVVRVVSASGGQPWCGCPELNRMVHEEERVWVFCSQRLRGDVRCTVRAFLEGGVWLAFRSQLEPDAIMKLV